MPFPGGVGGPAARPIPFPSRLCLASALSKYARNLETLAILRTFGGSPHSSPRGRLGFAEGKAEHTSMFVRTRALEGSEVSRKISKAYSLLLRETLNTSTNYVRIPWKFKDRSDVAAGCSKHW